MTPKLALTIVQVLCGLILIAVVMLQSGKSAGLSGAIAGGVDTFLSKNKAKTWDSKLAKLTKWVAFLLVVPPLFLTLINPLCVKKTRVALHPGFFYWFGVRARASSGRSLAICTQGHGAKSSTGVVPFKTAAKSTPARWAASASSTVSPQ